MTQHHLIKILSSLSRREMTRFREFVHSPYYNKHRDVRNLVSYLSGIYPSFTEKKCDRTTIFQQLFPDMDHDQQKLAVVFTYTFRLLEEFISVESNAAGQPSPVPLLRFYRQHGQLEMLEKKWKENIKGVNKIDNNTVDRHLLTRVHLFAELDQTGLALARHETNFLKSRQKCLDSYYLMEKLKDACELIQRSRFRKMNFSLSPQIKAILAALRTSSDTVRLLPSTSVYHSIFQLLDQNDPALYHPTLSILQQNESHLQADELQNSYNYLQNFCIAQINRGDHTFLRAIFDLYQLQLDKGLLLVNHFLPEWHYKNIVTTGLRLNETKWVLDFINRFRPLLNPEVAENAYSYNLAAYHYQQREYDRVLELLLQVEYTDLRYNLDAKSLLLRTYYDLEEEESLFALTDAFRQFLKRNRTLTEFQKKGYYNLLKFTRRLFRLKINQGFTTQSKWDKELLKLQQDATNAETVFNQGWLTGKIDELMTTG